MPISPDKKHLYPANWKEIRARILERAKDRCEFCGVRNHSHVIRYRGTDLFDYVTDDEIDVAIADGNKVVYIVLTIAHLDNDPTNNDEDNNLRALCQKCHNRHDVPFRKANRSHTRAIKSESKGQERMI